MNKYDCETATTDYINDLVTHNFIPYTFLPSRITATSATVIDHIYSNCRIDSKTSLKAGLITADISDHLCNFLFLISAKPKVAKERPLVRLYTTSNINNYLTDLAAVDWNSLLSIVSDVNCAYDIFISNLLNIFNTNFPKMRISRKSYKNKNWITAGLKKSINTKHKLYRKWINTKDISDEILYKSFAVIKKINSSG